MVVIEAQNNILKDLHIAIEAKDVVGVKSALAMGADPNALLAFWPSGIAVPSMVRAAQGEGAASVVDLLLVAGGDLAMRMTDGSPTLLEMAAANGDVALCRLLVERGAPVNGCAQDDWTALHMAANNGHSDVCSYLASVGADIFRLTKESLTALHLAARNNEVGCCRALLELGIPSSYAPTGSDESYLTPFQISVKYGMVRAAIMFVERCGEDPTQVVRSGVPVLDLPVDEATKLVMRHALLGGRVVSEINASVDGASVCSDIPVPRKNSGISPI